MSRPVRILPEQSIQNWFDASSSQTAEEQIVHAILDGMKMDDEDGYLKVSLTDIPDPSSMKNIDLAVDLFVQALLNGKKILVVGDYDVDGITSTALLIRFFRLLDFSNFDRFIPNRFLHGYGLTAKTVEIILEKTPDLVITVDNGITAKNEIKQIRDRGIDVIVTDHHLPQEGCSPDCVILNPKQQDCSYPYKHLSGVGVVFLFLVAIRSRLRSLGYWNGQRKEPNLLEQLDLVAMGTIADQVPLLGLNRIFAKYGLDQMTKKIHQSSDSTMFSYINVFAQNSRINAFSSESIAFNLAPMLNATGRLKDAEEGLSFLLSDDMPTAQSRFQNLERLNQKRRKKQQIMSKKALKLAEALIKEEKGVVVYSESFHEGLIGVIASHLVDRFFYPAVVMTDSEEGVLKASCRSRNVNMMEILNECKQYLIQFGGHVNAAGFSLKKESLLPFHKKYTEVCHERIPPAEAYQIKADIEVTLDMMTFVLIEKLRAFEPYGHKNRKPVFYIPGLMLPVPTTMTGKHLKWKLGADIEMIFWNGAENLKHSDCYDVAFTLGENRFRGEHKRQLVVNTIVPRLS